MLITKTLEACAVARDAAEEFGASVMVRGYHSETLGSLVDGGGLGCGRGGLPFGSNEGDGEMEGMGTGDGWGDGTGYGEGGGYAGSDGNGYGQGWGDGGGDGWGEGEG